MTKDDILEMARETGMELYGHGRDQTNFVFILCRFANAIAAAEREACAELCESFGSYEAHDCAVVIRARGEK